MEAKTRVKEIPLILACVVAILLVLSGNGIAAERLALVIGNSDYQELSTLANPKNDASDVAQRLQELGFKLHGEQVHYNLTERELLRQTSSFSKAVENAEIAFLYFAGHGIIIPRVFIGNMGSIVIIISNVYIQIKTYF